MLCRWELPACPQRGCVLEGGDSFALHSAAGILGEHKGHIFNFLTVIVESESGRAVLWDMLGFVFSFF